MMIISVKENIQENWRGNEKERGKVKERTFLNNVHP